MIGAFHFDVRRNMKRFTICITFLSILAFAYATRLDVESGIIGSWRFESDGVTVDISFLNEGRFQGRLHNDGETLWAFAGKWTLDRSHLYYLYTESSIESIPPGTEDVDEVVQVTPEFYDAKNRDGQINRYVRVPEAER